MTEDHDPSTWWDLPGAPPRYATRRDPTRDTYGPEATQVMERLGFEVMPWQRYVNDVSLEHEDGRLVYRQVGEVVPRQAGKTSKALGVQVHRATTLAKRYGRAQTSLYTAQRYLDARTRLLEDHWPILQRSPFSPYVQAIRRTADEGLKWSNQSIHHVAAGTWKAAHGSVLDLAHIDEAFAHADDAIEQGVKPAQITRRNAQLWVMSAAGDYRSVYLLGKVAMGRERCRRGVQSGSAYFEWSADGLDVDTDDPAVWAAHHPAVGFTIDAADLETDHEEMAPQEFARAYLAVWPTRRKPRIIGDEQWQAVADPSSWCLDPVVFAVDVTLNHDSASISAAGYREDGRYHIELIDHEAGTGWVVERCAHLLNRHKGATVALDSGSSTGSLLPAFGRAGIEPRLLTTADVSHSMGLLLDAIREDKVRHRDQLDVNLALAGADKRRIGHRWAWARGEVDDITPIVSATYALWALETRPEPVRFKMSLAV